MTDTPEDVPREIMVAAVLATWNDAPRCPGEMYPSEAALIVDRALSALRAAGWGIAPKVPDQLMREVRAAYAAMIAAVPPDPDPSE